MTGCVIHIYIWFNEFTQEINKEVGSMPSQEYNEPSPYFSDICLTIIKWLRIDITVTDTVNATSVL